MTQKNCDFGTCERQELMAKNARLRNVLMDARDKLTIYYERDKSYEGGVQYNVLMAQIKSLLGEVTPND